jgi:regulator of replication initiation timing
MQKSQGEAENYSQSKTFFYQCVNACKGPKGWLESTWTETPTQDANDLKQALQAALQEVAWLTKDNERLRRAESARLTRWEEMAKTDEERAAEAAAEAAAEDSAAAADLYGGFDWSAVR